MSFHKMQLLLITICVSTMLQAQETVTKEQQNVQQAIINFFEALSKRDSISLKQYCTADITLLENGSVWNADTLIRKAITLNTSPYFKRTNTFQFISTTVNKNTAWASYNLQSVITRNGKQSTVHWMETVIAVIEGKNWKIKLLHSTLLKRD